MMCAAQCRICRLLISVSKQLCVGCSGIWSLSIGFSSSTFFPPFRVEGAHKLTRAVSHPDRGKVCFFHVFHHVFLFFFLLGIFLASFHDVFYSLRLTCVVGPFD